MRSGYLYVLSNPILPSDVLKIGLTESTARNRANGLSRSSAIPLNFVVEREIPVADVITAERRVHLLLNPQRINPSKEFFRVSLPTATETCQAIADYELENGIISAQIGLTDRLLGAHYYLSQTRASTRTKTLIYALIGATTNNTPFDRISKRRRGVVDGFLTAPQVAECYAIEARSASNSMRRLALHGMALSCHQLNQPPITSIFDFIRYYKGHLAWQFTDEFREHFSNPKI